MRTLILLLAFSSCNLCAQDSLTVELLSKITHEFSIENGQLVGTGAEFLKEETGQSQFTMIGEYHGSKKISEFTTALIPELKKHGYSTMGLEVGPISGQVLSELSSDPEQVQNNLKVLNEKYLYLEDGDAYGPIPFFENVEDADFLKQVSLADWNIIGIDQEFYFSFPMLLDSMYAHLPAEKKRELSETHTTVQDSVEHYFILDSNDGPALSISLTQSAILQDYLDQLSKIPENEEIATAFRKSIEIYKLYAESKWFDNNKTRIQYMKQQLNKGLREKGFDIAKDKMLIKMGAYHLAKGITPLGFLEVGNTLSEIAAFHGNKSLNITFTNRYYMEEGKLVDIMDTENKFQKRYLHLAQMGQKDKWVVIDLRRLLKGIHYYPIRHLVNEQVSELINRYDILIIPPTETEPTPNYDIKN